MARREAIEAELAELRERSGEMKARWQNEKGAIEAIKGAKARLDEASREAERAERDADLERAAQLRYGEIPELEKTVPEQEARLAELHRDGGSMLTEEVTEEDVAQVVAKWTGIPVSRLMEGEVEKLIHMEERLHERVVGQDEAVEAVANALRRSRAGLADPNRPIGVFLFLGPTGVGKTELARALAEFMFDSEQAIVRLDMSEYMEKHTVARLIGAPPGYVGYEEGGQLTEAVRRRPYAVVLLDEIEKAHPDVFNVLLQIMDEGRLTDGQGRTVDFTNTILIMTSNVGSSEIAGETIDERIREQIEEILATTFKPEFLNRIDDTVIFHRLSRADLGRIVDLQVEHLAARLREKGIEIELTDDARTLLGNLGYDPTYGARPLKRVIQKQLIDKLALKLLEGEFARRRPRGGRRRRRRARLREGRSARRRGLPNRPAEAQRPERALEHANGAVEATTDLLDVARRAAPGDEHDLLRGEAPERVLDRLDRVGVAYRAAGRRRPPLQARPARASGAAGRRTRLPEVRQPVGERRVRRRRQDQDLGLLLRSGSRRFRPGGGDLADRAGERGILERSGDDDEQREAVRGGRGHLDRLVERGPGGQEEDRCRGDRADGEPATGPGELEGGDDRQRDGDDDQRQKPGLEPDGLESPHLGPLTQRFRPKRG